MTFWELRIDPVMGDTSPIPAGSNIFVENIWGWGKDERPGPTFHIAVVTDKTVTTEEACELLWQEYEAQCERTGVTPRDVYGLEIVDNRNGTFHFLMGT